MGGVLYQMGEQVPDAIQDIDGLRLWTRRLMRANELNPDPNTALVVATSALFGLVARARTGTGQRILMDMFGANAYANHDDFLSYPGKPPRALPDAELQGLAATYRLYQCEDDHWVFLALTNARERNRFLGALASAAASGDIVQSPQGLDETTLASNSDSLITRLGSLFTSKPAHYWETLFIEHQVACLQADATLPQDYWLSHPQAEANQLSGKATHPAWGAYKRHGSMLSFDGASPVFPAPPLAGQHNTEILTELGYSAAEIAELIEASVLWSEEE